MSVCVCVVNTQGIGIAADSAVTIRGGQMHYNNSKKLFKVSDKYCLGALTFSDASFYLMTPSQIIDEFKKYIDTSENIQIRKFADVVPLFKQFLESKNEYFRFDISSKNHIEDCIRNILYALREDIEDDNGQINITPSKLDEEIHKSCIYSIVNDDNLELAEFDQRKYLKNNFHDVYYQSVKEIVPELENEKFASLMKQFIVDICIYFNKNDVDSKFDYDMHFVFAGYGTDEIFPSFQEITLLNIINSEVKMVAEEIDSIDEFGGATIKPFAQCDIISTFDRGISGDFRDLISDHYEKINDNIIEKFKNSLSKKQIKLLKEKYNEYQENFDKNILYKEIRKTSVFPLLDSVEVLDPLNLAKLAGSLIDITTSKRTYFLDDNQQSVGGATDVAFITKNDGFVWIKKKDRIK